MTDAGRPVAAGMFWAAAAIATAAVPQAAAAQSARDLLTQASFGDRDKAVALRRVGAALQTANAVLRGAPDDREALIMQATAIGYRAKLTGSRTDAVDARKRFENVTARFPRDPDAQVGLGAWHVGAVFKLGRLMARAALGAQKPIGLAALERSVALGESRAMFPALAGLLRLELDPADARGRALIEAAARGTTPTALDRILQRSATTMLGPLRTGKPDAVKEMAARLLPFGTLPED